MFTPLSARLRKLLKPCHFEVLCYRVEVSKTTKVTSQALNITGYRDLEKKKEINESSDEY